jgi:hypothetical protein
MTELARRSEEGEGPSREYGHDEVLREIAASGRLYAPMAQEMLNKRAAALRAGGENG